MRRVREITAEEERFRLEQPAGSPFVHPRRDSVQPEPIGTLLLVPMRVVGYDPDCDGSLMARLEVVALDELDKDLDPEILEADMMTARSYGVLTNQGLYPSSGFVVTAEEVRALERQG